MPPTLQIFLPFTMWHPKLAFEGFGVFMACGFMGGAVAADPEIGAASAASAQVRRMRRMIIASDAPSIWKTCQERFLKHDEGALCIIPRRAAMYPVLYTISKIASPATRAAPLWRRSKVANAA